MEILEKVKRNFRLFLHLFFSLKYIKNIKIYDAFQNYLRHKLGLGDLLDSLSFIIYVYLQNLI